MTQQQKGTFIVDNQPVPYQQGDSILIAMIRAGHHPTGGGTLCCGGDCPHCLATVDGISYIRTCQAKPKAGQVVVTNQMCGEYPPLPEVTDNLRPDYVNKHFYCDLAIIGEGESGLAEKAKAEAEGKTVISIDSANGQDAVGIYIGPLLIVRTETELWQIHAKEIVVATGSAEIHPVAPGNHMVGILTNRAAEAFSLAGLDLGKVVSVGTPPSGIETTALDGSIVRFEGDTHVTGVTVADSDGNETTVECDTVTVGLGFHPRNALLRMGHGLNVRTVGDAAAPSDIPTCPSSGMVCHCSGVQAEDIHYAWDSGFQELELVKRATLAGTGTCQGSVCLPYIRSILQDRGLELQNPFTARPVTRQLTIGEMTAGHHLHPTPRTALHNEHVKLGAQMDRIGGWWRPWTYGDLDQEYWAVRSAVSLGDVSTLGKFIIRGPDALEFLERLYPTKISTIRPGRSKYVLMLNERGYIFEDGLVSCNAENDYTLSFTSSGATYAEFWLRDYADGWGMDVNILNQTIYMGAINVTGPLTHELMRRAGLEKPLRYMRHTTGKIADIECRIYRLSFTGEASYELHHHHADSAALWTKLMELGADLGIKPHGLQALQLLRLEKGHIIIGMDTEFDSTPRRIHHDWAVNLDKEFFLGKQAIIRTNDIPLNTQLVGFTLDRDAPVDGTSIYSGEEYVGYVTSAGYSRALGYSVMMGWLDLVDGEFPTDLTIDGRPATRTDLPFYDKESARAKA